MIYDNYSYYGMHFVWWFVWIFLLFWIFATPYEVPFQRAKKDSPLYNLKRRLASGQLTKEQYYEQKLILEKE